MVLPRADVVRNGDVDARQQEGLSEGFELVGVKPNACPER